MSTRFNSPNGGGGPTNNQGTDRPIPDTIDFVYDYATEGDVTANAEVKGTDYTTIHGENETDSNEIMEVTRIEMIPPKDDDGSLESFEALRLYDGSNFYDYLRYREFMLGFFGPDYGYSTPPLGVSVLSGQTNPNQNPIDTATPKFGTSTEVSPALVNDGNAITDSFRVRLHVWRWKGTDQEFQDYIQSTYGQTRFTQNIRMTNPFTGASRTYTRKDPVTIQKGADGGALGQFTKLTGGVDQELPKVFPWATWTENNNATRANKEYEFNRTNDRVDEAYKSLEFDFTDEKEAVFFDTVQVDDVTNLEKVIMHMDERDEDPEIMVPPNSAHELPFLRPLDGTVRKVHANGDLPVSLADRLDGRQVIWDDGGGLRAVDDGTSIGANNILIGVEGKRLELTS